MKERSRCMSIGEERRMTSAFLHHFCFLDGTTDWGEIINWRFLALWCFFRQCLTFDSQKIVVSWSRALQYPWKFGSLA